MLNKAALMMVGKKTKTDPVLRIQGNVEVTLQNGVAEVRFGKEQRDIEIPFYELDEAAVYQVYMQDTLPSGYIIAIDNLVQVGAKAMRIFDPDTGIIANEYYQIEDHNKDAYFAIIG